MKQKALKIINPLLMISLFIQIIAVGLLFAEVGEDTQLGFTIFLAHKFNGIALVLIGLIHLILNWNWVKSMFKGAKS
jgi:hypothetical protein